MDIARHLTDEERADVKAIINKPFIDQEVVYEILSEGGASSNEMFHWAISKRELCHELKVDEPAFTKEELLAICNAEKEEDKRRMFSEIMTSKMKSVLQNEAEIRGGHMRHIEEQPVTLFTLAGGALGELFDREMERVSADILDLNTEAEAVRTITIKVKIKPDKDRGFGYAEMLISSTLGAPKGVGSTMYFGRKNGHATAIEAVSEQRELFDPLGPRPVVELKSKINTKTGEVVNG